MAKKALKSNSQEPKDNSEDFSKEASVKKDELDELIAEETETSEAPTTTDEDVAPSFPADTVEDEDSRPETKTEGESIDPADNQTNDAPATVVMSSKPGRFGRFKRWYGSHKKLSIPLTIAALLVVLSAVPYTRYLLVGTVWRQNYTVKVTDAETNKPVSSASIKINGKDATTNGQGEATLKLNVGKAKLHIEKKYYQSSDTDVLVPIFKQKHSQGVALKATGRQITVTVINKVSKKAVKEATVTAFDTKAKTNKDGQASLVVPADKQKASATIEANGYNKTSADVTVSADEKANKITLTPSGQVYFLSNASGKIDVVKSNLDGTDRKVVLAGTGKENKNTTVLLASRDWKYLALLSHRDNSKYDKVYLIDTSNDSLTTMDEGEAFFTLVGWSDHRFAFKVQRDNKNQWDANSSALKTFDASNKKLTTITQEGGEGTPSTSYFANSFVDEVFLLKNEIVYFKKWSLGAAYPPTAKKQEIHSVKVDGSNNKVVASYDVMDASKNYQFVNGRLYEPQGIWIKQTADKTEEYEDGTIKTITNVSWNSFNGDDYPTYLISPNGNMTFWQNVVDGKNKLSVGDSDGNNAKEIAVSSPYSVYGWYTDDYLLVTKDSSELYVMPVAGGDPVKMTDYYKPPVKFYGYGGGYGGL